MRKLNHEEIPRAAPAALKEMERFPVSVLVEDIRSAHNVGSILRTADAVRAAEVILCGFSASGDHPGVQKSALGSQDTVPWRNSTDALKEINIARQQGATIVALEITDSPGQLDSLSLTDFPILLVVGNEVNGVSDEVLSVCDIALELPQYGAKQSLNVAVAAGIALYDILKLYLKISDRRPEG